jgi:uncharacterized protein
MGNPQAEPSMDEILASIRRIIAEEDDTPKERTPVREKLETLELTQKEQVEAAAKEEKKAKKPSLRKKPVTEAVADTETSVGEGEAEDVSAVEETAPEVPAEESFEQPVAEAAVPEVEDVVPEEAALDEALDDFETPKMKAQTAKASKMTAPKAASVVAEAVQARTAAPVSEPTSAPVSEIDAGQSAYISETSSEAASSAFEALAENIRITDDGGKTIEDMVQTMLQPLLVQWLDQNLPRIVEEKVEEEVRRLSRRR